METNRHEKTSRRSRAMGVRELKHEALLQEWTARIGECRTSGMSVKAWCKTQGISIKTYYYWEKQFVEKVKEQALLPSAPQTGAFTGQNQWKSRGRNADCLLSVTIFMGKGAVAEHKKPQQPLFCGNQSAFLPMTALMRRTPADEDSSFRILKLTRSPVLEAWGPPQISLE